MLYFDWNTLGQKARSTGLNRNGLSVPIVDEPITTGVKATLPEVIYRIGKRNRSPQLIPYSTMRRCSGRWGVIDGTRRLSLIGRTLSDSKWDGPVPKVIPA